MSAEKTEIALNALEIQINEFKALLLTLDSTLQLTEPPFENQQILKKTFVDPALLPYHLQNCNWPSHLLLADSLDYATYSTNALIASYNIAELSKNLVANREALDNNSLCLDADTRMVKVIDVRTYQLALAYQKFIDAIRYNEPVRESIGWVKLVVIDHQLPPLANILNNRIKMYEIHHPKNIIEILCWVNEIHTLEQAIIISSQENKNHLEFLLSPLVTDEREFTALENIISQFRKQQEATNQAIALFQQNYAKRNFPETIFLSDYIKSLLSPHTNDRLVHTYWSKLYNCVNNEPLSFTAEPLRPLLEEKYEAVLARVSNSQAILEQNILNFNHRLNTARRLSQFKQHISQVVAQLPKVDVLLENISASTQMPDLPAEEQEQSLLIERLEAKVRVAEQTFDQQLNALQQQYNHFTKDNALPLATEPYEAAFQGVQQEGQEKVSAILTSLRAHQESVSNTCQRFINQLAAVSAASQKKLLSQLHKQINQAADLHIETQKTFKQKKASYDAMPRANEAKLTQLKEAASARCNYLEQKLVHLNTFYTMIAENVGIYLPIAKINRHDLLVCLPKNEEINQLIDKLFKKAEQGNARYGLNFSYAADMLNYALQPMDDDMQNLLEHLDLVRQNVQKELAVDIESASVPHHTSHEDQSLYSLQQQYQQEYKVEIAREEKLPPILLYALEAHLAELAVLQAQLNLSITRHEFQFNTMATHQQALTDLLKQLELVPSPAEGLALLLTHQIALASIEHFCNEENAKFLAFADSLLITQAAWQKTNACAAKITVAFPEALKTQKITLENELNRLHNRKALYAEKFATLQRTFVNLIEKKVHLQWEKFKQIKQTCAGLIEKTTTLFILPIADQKNLRFAIEDQLDNLQQNNAFFQEIVLRETAVPIAEEIDEQKNLLLIAAKQIECNLQRHKLFVDYFGSGTKIEGVFGNYLIERALTFYFRDLFSSILAFTFGIFGYKTEATLRMEYLTELKELASEYQKKPFRTEYDTLIRKIDAGLKNYSPRASKGLDYECSLNFKLGQFKFDLNAQSEPVVDKTESKGSETLLIL